MKWRKGIYTAEIWAYSSKRNGKTIFCAKTSQKYIDESARRINMKHTVCQNYVNKYF
jgi:hypothetical protein